MVTNKLSDLGLEQQNMGFTFDEIEYDGPYFDNPESPTSAVIYCTIQSDYVPANSVQGVDINGRASLRIAVKFVQSDLEGMSEQPFNSMSRDETAPLFRTIATARISQAMGITIESGE